MTDLGLCGSAACHELISGPPENLSQFVLHVLNKDKQAYFKL